MRMNILLVDVWTVFFLYWVGAGILTSLQKTVSVRGDTWFAGALQWAVYGLAIYAAVYAKPGSFWMAPLFARSSWATSVFGLAILTASLTLAVYARVALGRNWSGISQLVQGHSLVTSGPYRMLRNPIYTGMIGGFIGTLFAQPTIGSATGAALIIVFYLWKIPNEEAFMHRAFGAAYERYREHTYSFIPFFY